MKYILVLFILLTVTNNAVSNELQVKALTKFADVAQIGDANGLLEMFAPPARVAEGDKKILTYIKEKIIPFFSDHTRLTYNMRIEPRTMPDNSVGYRYYTYDFKKNGTEVPFDIIMVEYEGKAYFANFNAHGCIENMHPANATCPPKQGVSKTTEAQLPADDNEDITVKKLVTFDMIETTCKKINLEGSRAARGKLKTVLFPKGEPKNSALIRESEKYKMLYEYGMDKVQFTPEGCTEL